jgi:hypothetical protein
MTRYTITFNPNLSSILKPLQKIQDLGINIESAQNFIGTAIVQANEDQLSQLNKITDIVGITKTTTVSAI